MNETPCRLIIDPPLPGAWNMAVDEWLLRSAADEGILSLRFYQWAEPTLSLGYFQRHADRTLHAASADCPLVRRASGGGALLHDRELTYSLAVPAAHSLARKAEELYFAVHESLIELLTTLSPAKFQLCEATTLRGTDEPFLCFSRRAQGDVLFARADSEVNHKLCGSAQRRRRGAVLQHGGVLLAQSPQAPELQGLREVAGVAITAGGLCESWLDSLLQKLKLKPQGQVSSDTLIRAEIGHLSTKFESRTWNERR